MKMPSGEGFSVDLLEEQCKGGLTVSEHVGNFVEGWMNMCRVSIEETSLAA